MFTYEQKLHFNWYILCNEQVTFKGFLIGFGDSYSDRLNLAEDGLLNTRDEHLAPTGPKSTGKRILRRVLSAPLLSA